MIQAGPAGGHALDVVEAVAERLGPVLPRGARQVRRDRMLSSLKQRMIGGRRLLDHDGEAAPAIWRVVRAWWSAASSRRGRARV